MEFPGGSHCEDRHVESIIYLVLLVLKKLVDAFLQQRVLYVELFQNVSDFDSGQRLVFGLAVLVAEVQLELLDHCETSALCQVP